ncbi:MAG: hypothetical protein U9Q07_05455 [Planctomycetota bacterium]|nr:hypothetical protein [Planctomycetota bacterium]
MNQTAAQKTSRIPIRNVEDRVSRIERVLAMHQISGGHRRIAGHHVDMRPSASERLYVIYTDRKKTTLIYRRQRKYNPLIPGQLIYEKEDFFENGVLKETYISEDFVYDPPIAVPIEWEVRRFK